eukprot:GGOE01034021.1.p1 GENE.GGOE01034021.1~~GGOE01034021.1.p1  ORF type:complete len:364 (+),score=27.06 GGOE01034021.1:41-1093(+)
MATFGITLPVGTQLREASPSVHAAADMDVPICLDFLKGRCLRKQCRFLHPDLSQYQQLSTAVHAQAGRHVCEVWAMTGQCRFGAKCSKLHPSVVVSPPAQPVMTLLLPVAVMPQPVLVTSAEPMAASSVPQQRQELPASPALLPTSFRPPNALLSAPTGFHVAAPSPHSPLVTASPPTPFSPNIPNLIGQAITIRAPQPLSITHAPVPPGGFPPQLPPRPPPAFVTAPTTLPPPQHVSPPPGLQQYTGNLQVELQDLEQSLLTVMQAEKTDLPSAPPIFVGRIPAGLGSDRSNARLSGMDSDAERSFDQPSSTGQTLAVPNPSHRQSRSLQHDRDRAFLDMLRGLHNAGH